MQICAALGQHHALYKGRTKSQFRAQNLFVTSNVVKSVSLTCNAAFFWLRKRLNTECRNVVTHVTNPRSFKKKGTKKTPKNYRRSYDEFDELSGDEDGERPSRVLESDSLEGDLEDLISSSDDSDALEIFTEEFDGEIESETEIVENADVSETIKSLVDKFQRDILSGKEPQITLEDICALYPFKVDDFQVKCHL